MYASFTSSVIPIISINLADILQLLQFGLFALIR
jgi:hypothetical protein